LSKNNTSWTDLNFIERKMIPIMSPELQGIENIKWINFEANSDNDWCFNINELVMDFGGVFHSIFLRWAVTVNGLHVASEKYKSKKFIESGKAFAVQGIRNPKDGSSPNYTNVKVWSGEQASEVHSSSVPMLAAWAFCNMYSCLEEFVFSIFREYLNENPMTICKGPDFIEIRKIYDERNVCEENLFKWNDVWIKRLDSWHRKKIYDGLEKVFTNFILQTKLKIPSFYSGEYDYSHIAKTLRGISLIRNCFIHGVSTVPGELGDFCKGFESTFFEFETGQPFEVTLNELSTLEHFTDTFTQTLNNSLFELRHPNLKSLIG